MTEQTEALYPRPLVGDEVKDLPGGLVPARSNIEGRHIRLEPLDPARHGDALYAASHESEEGLGIWTYLPEGPWPDRQAFDGHLRANAGSLDRIFYALCSTSDGVARGQASYMDMHPANGVIEIGYIWFAPELQRTRAATEAMYLMLDYAMSELRYRRMQWRCNSLNAKSRAAARRLGFRFEGIFHNHLIFKGKNRDTAWYSILDDEWPTAKANLERWLADDNFDQRGQARTSLTALMDARPPSTRGSG